MTGARSPHSGKSIPSKRELLWLHEGRVCHWCRKPTRYINGNAWDAATVDHVIPRYRGGSNDHSNLVSACNLCNRRRCYEDQKSLPEGIMLGRYPVAKQRGQRGWPYYGRRSTTQQGKRLNPQLANKGANGMRDSIDINTLEMQLDLADLYFDYDCGYEEVVLTALTASNLRLVHSDRHNSRYGGRDRNSGGAEVNLLDHKLELRFKLDAPALIEKIAEAKRKAEERNREAFDE